MACCTWSSLLRRLENESRKTGDEPDGAGTGAGLICAVDSDNTWRSGGPDGSIGRHSGSCCAESRRGRAGGAAAKVRSSRHKCGRRRNTSNGRHACAGSVGDGGWRGTTTTWVGWHRGHIHTRVRHSAGGSRSLSGARNLGGIRARQCDGRDRRDADGARAG